MINGFTAQDTIRAVQNWSMKDGNEDFDCSFVNDLSEKLEEYDSLTERQEAALSNIVERFEIDVASNL